MQHTYFAFSRLYKRVKIQCIIQLTIDSYDDFNYFESKIDWIFWNFYETHLLNVFYSIRFKHFTLLNFFHPSVFCLGRLFLKMTGERNFQFLCMYSSQFLQKQEPFLRYVENQQQFHQDNLSKYFLFEEKLLNNKTKSFESLIKRCILEKKKMCNEDYRLIKNLCVDSMVHIAAYKPMDRLNQRLELYPLSNYTSI